MKQDFDTGSECIGYQNVDITGGFWKAKQDMVREVTIHSVYRRFKETGRFDAFRFAWKEGEPGKPDIFWESDVAKWLESAAYLTDKQAEPELEKIVDETVRWMEEHQDENGYFNSYFTVVEPEKRFTYRSHHELYCLGHLIEAACAYFEATGKDRFLQCVMRYADHVYQVFVQDQSASFVTPGHEEIELALIKLYHTTKQQKYLELAKFFIDKRGTTDEYRTVSGPTYDSLIGREGEKARRYAQDHLPVREQREVFGHAVRALYLYCGMADVARETQDRALYDACVALFDDIVTKKMYLTGGVGSTHVGEAFTVPYDLPNPTAYAETCAAIALCFFCQRMLTLSKDARYADLLETVLYNGFLSGVSLDGTSFFYENPLEIDLRLHHRNTSTQQTERFPITQRLEVFGCSCCPPNVTRLIASVGGYVYTQKDQTLYVNQYMESEARLCGGAFRIVQKTAYPADGRIDITSSGTGIHTLALRIPSFCGGKFRLVVNGQPQTDPVREGYVRISLKPGENTVALSFDLTPYLIRASGHVAADAGKVAVARGPVVYCMESVGNPIRPQELILSSKQTVSVEGGHDTDHRGIKPFGLPVLSVRGFVLSDKGFERCLYQRADQVVYEDVTVELIPYYAFANRGESDMAVFFPVRDAETGTF